MFYLEGHFPSMWAMDFMIFFWLLCSMPTRLNFYYVQEPEPTCILFWVLLFSLFVKGRIRGQLRALEQVIFRRCFLFGRGAIKGYLWRNAHPVERRSTFEYLHVWTVMDWLRGPYRRLHLVILGVFIFGSWWIDYKGHTGVFILWLWVCSFLERDGLITRAA